MLKQKNFSEFSVYLLANEAEKRGVKVRQLFWDRKMSQILMTHKKRNELLINN